MADQKPPSKGAPLPPQPSAKPQAQPGPRPQAPAAPQRPVAPGPAGARPLGGASPGAPTKVTLSKGRAKVGINFKAQERRDEEERKSKEEAESKIPVEERVFAIPGLKELKAPELFTQFMEKVAPKIILPSTSENLIEAFSSIDVTAERVSQVVKANPYFESLFFRVVENLAKREEMPSVEGSIVLLGMQNFRNLILAAQMQRTVMGAHPEWDPSGKLKLNPSEYLKYALKTEELLVSGKNEYADTAYAAGLLFDVLSAVATAVSDDKKKVHGFIEATYNHGLRTAQIATAIAKHVPDLGFQKYVFSAALLHDVGKIGIAIVRPGYINSLEDARKKEWARPIRQFVETEKWGVNHTTIGALICHLYKMFRPIQRVVQYHHQPYLMRKYRNYYPITSLVCLATNIANNFKKTDKVDDPIVGLWKGAELHDFRVDMRGVVDSVAKSVQI